MTHLPLATHELLRDGDLGDVVSVGSQLFWQNHGETVDPGGPINARFNGLNLGVMSIACLSFGTEVTIEPVCNEQHLIVQTSLTGQSTTVNGHQKVAAEPGDVVVIDASLPTKIQFAKDCAHLVLKIDRALIAQKLSQLLQQDIGGPVVFDLLPESNGAFNRAWMETMRFLCAFYDRPQQENLPGDHLLHSHLDLATCTLISCGRHSYSGRLNDTGDKAAPGHIRRSCEYIDAHIKDSLTLADLCRASGVSERALQLGFKKHLGLTPTAFIRNRRLHHLHQALLHADGRTNVSRTNVSRVMWDHGISNPGRWAQLYYRRYGCYPAQTLAGTTRN